MTTIDQRVDTRRTLDPQPWIGSLWGAGAALVLNSVVFVAANAMLASSIQTAQSGKTPTDLPYLAVAAACVIAMLVGAAVLWDLGRFTRLGLQAWSVLAAAITLLSLLAPISMKVDTGSKVALGLMHLLAGAAAIWGQRHVAKLA